MDGNTSRTPCPDDNAFGPAVSGCRDDFDFTLRFEQSFFSLTPSALLILLTALRIWRLSSRRPFVKGTVLQWGKVGVIACYGAVQLALLVLWARRALHETSTTLAAAVLSFVSALGLAALSWLEHARSPRPSTLLNVYLVVSVLFDAVQARTLWLKSLDYSIQALFSAGLAVKLALLALEAIEKGAYLPKEWASRSPEERAGVLNKSIMLWLSSIFEKGRRSLLSMSDVSALDGGLESGRLADAFSRCWKAQSPPVKPSSLIPVLIRSLKWQFLAPVIPRLAQCAFMFCQPFLIYRLLSYLQGDGRQSDGYGLIGAYAVVYLGKALTTCLYQRLVYRSLVQMRGCLVAVIYEKTIEIDTAHYDMSAPVSLMSTDIERIIYGLRQMHEVWACIVQVAIAVWLLYEQLGVACVAPAVCALVCGFGTTAVSARAGKYQVSWMEATQKRVGATSSMIASIKGIRFLGLSELVYDTIRKLRVRELRSARNFRYVEVLAATIAFAPLLLSPVFTFIIFVLRARSTGEVLDITRVFTSISLLQLMTQPLAWLFTAVPAVFAAGGCLNRIGEYLLARTRIESRTFDPSSSERSERISEEDIVQEISGKQPESKSFNLAELRRPVTGSSTDTSAALVRIKNGRFGWSDEKLVLDDVNIEVPAGQLTMIVGPVASGKTTLCRAMIGELPLIRGDINIRSSRQQVAFCDQNPFLTNASIRRNILGSSNYDRAWYEAVVRAVGLNADFETMTEGDGTKVGSKGVNLSGGQRQRVSIARAVYARCPLVIFDDVLSGLDALTQGHVFKHVFGRQGLLKKLGTSAILCTHAIDLLPEADHIIALGVEARVEQTGTFAQLSCSPGYISSLALKSGKGKVREADASTEKAEMPGASLLANLEKEEAMLTDDQSRRLGDIGVFKFFAAAIGTQSLLIFSVYQLGWGVFSTVGTAWLNIWSTENDKNGGNVNDGYYLGVYAVFQILGLMFLALFAGYSLTTMAVKAGTRLHTVSLDTVIRAPISFFSGVDMGTTTNRFSQDISLIDGNLFMSLLDVVSSGLVAIAQMILIAIATPYVAASYPFVFAILYFVQKFYLRTSRQLRFLELEAKSPLYTHFLETVQGLATIRSFGWSKESILTNHQILDESQRPVYLLYMIQRWLQLVLDILTMVMAVILVGVAVSLPPGSTGFIGVGLVNLMSISNELKTIVVSWTDLETSLSAVARTKTFSEQTASEHGEFEVGVPPESWPHAGRIEIKAASGTYDASKPDQLAFQNISISINPGEKVAICGRSGSGKSSMAMSIARMVELAQGSITIDGLDISTMSRTALRRRLNMVPQESYYMDDILSKNLNPWGTSSPEDMERALRRAGLWQTVEDLGGIDAKIDYDALSQGQRQQFALARAMMHKSNIVVLDEATSSIDRHTDEIMQRAIREELHGKTVVAVAHRLDTIMDYDRVIVMRAGRLIECGSPRELLQRDSAFKQLCSAQGVVA